MKKKYLAAILGVIMATTSVTVQRTKIRIKSPINWTVTELITREELHLCWI